MLATLCGLQGIATAVIDLGRTHATHPAWPGHARFHVVWQTANVLLLSIFEIGLISINGPLTTYRFFDIAAVLAGAPMLGFFITYVSRKLYGATPSDPQGMPSWIVRARGALLRIDLNLVAEIVGLTSLAAIVELYRAP